MSKSYFVVFRILLIAVAAPVWAQQIEVMTYNIRFDNPADGINQWSARREKVYDLLKKYSPDILGIQEALHNQLTDIQKNLDGYTFIGVGRDDGKQKGEYSAIFYRSSRFDVIKQNTFWLSETPEVPGSKSWDAAITRVATWAMLRDKKTNMEFVIMNTHFDHLGKEARNQSARILKTKAKEIADDLPVIITGDLNFTRDEPPYKVLMDPTDLELNDAAPKNPGGTFCNFGVKSQECRAIDYIFYTNDWLIEKYCILYDNDGKNYPSDHVPVVVRLMQR
jgi:endonuclease/exonuclease/phosphatase family metal-dependent hydrolase